MIEADRMPIKLGAQNVHFAAKGAHTGEVSATMLQKLNVSYVIVGHSERRAAGENSAEVNANAQSLNQQDREKIRAAGTSEIVQLNAEDLDSWRAVMRPVWDEFGPEIGAEIMAATPAGQTD